MTKSVRIENADTSSYKVVVKVEVKNAAGEWVPADPAIGQDQRLDYPTQMLTAGIHSHRRLVIEEAPE
jgi:hypothetical protein